MDEKRFYFNIFFYEIKCLKSSYHLCCTCVSCKWRPYNEIFKCDFILFLKNKIRAILELEYMCSVFTFVHYFFANFNLHRNYYVAGILSACIEKLLTHSLMHCFETFRNSKKLQTTTEITLAIKGFWNTDCIENIVEKGEIAHFEQFHIFSQCFPRAFSLNELKMSIYAGKG